MDNVDNDLTTPEQISASRSMRAERSRRRDYRERGAALYSIAVVMMTHGISAAEAASNKYDDARKKLMWHEVSEKGFVEIDESIVLGLLQTDINVLAEDVDSVDK